MAHKRIKMIWAALTCFESIYFIICSIMNGITFFSMLTFFFNTGSLGRYETLFCAGIIKPTLVWWGLEEQDAMKNKDEFVSFNIAAIIFSLSGLITYAIDEHSLKIHLFWTIGTILDFTLTILLLAAIKRENVK